MPDPTLTSPSLPGDALVRALSRAGLLTSDRYLEALALVRDDRFWQRWGQRALLALAVGQILAGIVFFFAFNWAALPPFAKLGLIQAGIVLCVVGAWLGRDRPAAWEALVTAAALLVGVLLAVFGQIYQTGADAYTLFAGWAALILPWVVLSRAVAAWTLWLVVVGIGMATWAAQIAVPLGWLGTEELAAAMMLFYALALAGFEALRRLGFACPPWLRRLLAAAILGIGFTAAAPAVFAMAVDRSESLALGGFAAAVIGLGVVYERMRDFPVVVLAVLAGSVFLTLLGVRLLLDLEAALVGWGGMLLVVLAVFGTAFALLRRLWERMRPHGQP